MWKLCPHPLFKSSRYRYATGVDLLFFALPYRAALGFKIFSNVVRRVKSLPTPGIDKNVSKSFLLVCGMRVLR